MSPGGAVERGFTLVEALVAVTLLALICGALMPVFQQGLAVLDRGDRHTRAALLAQALLDEHAVALEPDAAPAPESGAEGPFEWQVLRAPYDPTSDGGPPVDATRDDLALVRVSVRVWWSEVPGVELSTLVLERAP